MEITTHIQARLVDAIKRSAMARASRTRSGEAWLLAGYLWSEECAEALALARAVAQSGPEWLRRMLERQLADEARHAALLRGRLAAMGRPVPDGAGVPVAGAGLASAGARAKLFRLDRVCRAATPRFARGALVPFLACAARMEGTGVRVFARHVAVLEEKERRTGRTDETAEVLRSILADEKRHARGCETALERLVAPEERAALAELRERIAEVDRAFGVTSSLAVWAMVAGHRIADVLAGRVA